MFTEINILQLIVGGVLAFLVALLSWRVKVLTAGGASAAFLLGTIFFGLGGLSWSMLLLIFFITSSLLSRIFKKQKVEEEANYAKGSQRDASQVLANGGLAGAFVLLHLVFPSSPLPWIGAAAALAAANADTWATELGVFSPADPVLITNGRRVSRGTSGGVSLVGTLASLAGAAVIGFGSFFLQPGGWNSQPVSTRWLWFGVVTLGGLLGSLVDSWLGAAFQAIYYCPVCKKETEKYPQHSCGAPTMQVRGLAWMDNDWVNLFCTSTAALLALLTMLIL